MRVNEKAQQRTIALERVRALFGRASEARDVKLADRYVVLARRIQMRFKLRMPREFRYRFCKKCGAYWAPGRTVRVRSREGRVVFTCLRCKAMRRILVARHG